MTEESFLYDEHGNPIKRPVGNKGEKRTFKWQKPSIFTKEEIEEIKKNL